MHEGAVGLFCSDVLSNRAPPSLTRLRRNGELFIEVTRFIWDANPSYDVYHEFTKRHFQARYKVHELIGARLKMEKQKQQSAAADDLTDNTRHYEGGFFKRLFRRRASRSQSAACEAQWPPKGLAKAAPQNPFSTAL